MQNQKAVNANFSYQKTRASVKEAKSIQNFSFGGREPQSVQHYIHSDGVHNNVSGTASCFYTLYSVLRTYQFSHHLSHQSPVASVIMLQYRSVERLRLTSARFAPDHLPTSLAATKSEHVTSFVVRAAYLKWS